ncbi:MAG: DUF4199 domain-containing protein [Staphylococcus sp.]|nr:DUF4199 domain-containing protein [Staphylococcus sp.]
MTSTGPHLDPSPYRRGADYGFLFGIYLTVMFFAFIFSQTHLLVSALALFMLLAIPGLLVGAMRHYDKSMYGCATFPMMWMLGVMMFLCGLIISCCALIIYLKWINPDLIFNQLKFLVDSGKETDSEFIRQAGTLAAEMIEYNFVPSATAYVTEIFLALLSAGSITSLVFGFLYTRLRLSKHDSGGRRQL